MIRGNVLRSFWRRGLGALSLVALVSVPPSAPGAAEAGAAPARTQAKGEEIDAEMLRDLELLSSPDHARDREIARRMNFLERMRLLQALPRPDNQLQPAGTAPPTGPAKAR